MMDEKGRGREEDKDWTDASWRSHSGMALTVLFSTQVTILMSLSLGLHFFKDRVTDPSSGDDCAIVLRLHLTHSWLSQRFFCIFLIVCHIRACNTRQDWRNHLRTDLRLHGVQRT